MPNASWGVTPPSHENRRSVINEPKPPIARSLGLSYFSGHKNLTGLPWVKGLLWPGGKVALTLMPATSFRKGSRAGNPVGIHHKIRKRDARDDVTTKQSPRITLNSMTILTFQRMSLCLFPRLVLPMFCEPVEALSCLCHSVDEGSGVQREV